jgi:DNA polymerase III alpha subunit (gram-positive type)
MKYLVFDFETTGVGKDANNFYLEWPKSQMPQPRTNFPIQVSASVVEEDGIVSSSDTMFIKGATRLDPWVLANCPTLSVDLCEKEGVDFMVALKRLADMSVGCTLVAHNMQYDWDTVIVQTVIERGAEKHEDYIKLSGCPRFCTCVNTMTKKDKTAYFFKRIGTWIGPKLATLALLNGVSYDTTRSHDASYDVEVTVACLCKIKDLHVSPNTVKKTRLV